MSSTKNLNRTLQSMLARGLSTQEADALMSDGHNLQSARSLSIDSLVNYGIDPSRAEKFRSGQRPEIGLETIVKLISDSASTCCICQRPNRPFIFHHIEEWSEGGGHDERNLVLLCTEDHDNVHLTGGLTRRYSPDIVRGLKEEWITKVKHRADQHILNSLFEDHVYWDYINIRRLFELADDVCVNYLTQPFARDLLELGMIHPDGSIASPEHWRLKGDPPRRYLTEPYEGRYVIEYLASILRQVVPHLNYKDVTNSWSRGQFLSMRPGDYFLCQKAFYTKPSKSVKRGSGQVAEVYRSEGGVKLSFTIDLWEACSSSSRSEHLSGHKTLTPICRITSVRKTLMYVEVSASCLAISGTARIHESKGRRSELDVRFNKYSGVLRSWPKVPALLDDEEDEADSEEQPEPHQTR